jgi:hypothetical protein
MPPVLDQITIIIRHAPVDMGPSSPKKAAICRNAKMVFRLH